MHDKFQLCFLATYESDDQVVRLTKKIPHSENFERLIVEKQEEPLEKAKLLFDPLACSEATFDDIR